MSTELIIRPKKQIRLNQIIELLAQNQDPKTIQKELQLTRTQYYRDIKDIQKELFNPEMIQEKALKILTIREKLVENTLADYYSLNQDYPAKIVTCKLLKELLTDLEGTYEKLGLWINKNNNTQAFDYAKIYEECKLEKQQKQEECEKNAGLQKSESMATKP